jgi:hypothetical protein
MKDAIKNQKENPEKILEEIMSVALLSPAWFP